MEFLSILPRLDAWVGVACVVILGIFAVSWGAMLVQYALIRYRIRVAVRTVAKFRIQDARERRVGRRLETFEQIVRAGHGLGRNHLHWWTAFEGSVEKYSAPDGREGYFLTRPAGDVVPLGELTQGYRGTFYHAVPAVLTSLGLLATFIAILLGLKGLSIDQQSGTVQGLADLIANLSGKFVTSIVALFLSVVFVLFELGICQPGLRKAHTALVRTLSEAMPYLVPSRVLLDIQRLSAKQAASLGNISADVVDKFAAVFRADLAPVFAQGISSSMVAELQAEIGPLLKELRGAMSELAATVARLEATKQESIVGELRGLIDALERSLQQALADMARQFHDALTGSTQEEFGKLAGTISGSATVLQEMSSSFTMLQGTLQSVIEEARSTTTEQISSGALQTQRLTALVEGLITRLNDTANSNYQQLSTTLAAVVTRLSEQVSALSQDLAATVESATSRSQATVEATLRRADEWGADTGKRLGEVLESLERNSTRFEQAGQLLLQAQGVLGQTLDRNNDALAALATAAGEVKTYTNALAGIQQRIAEGQDAQARVAALSRDAVARLTEAAGQHRDFLGEYERVFNECRAVFEGLDQRLATALDTILDKLQDYRRNIEESFRAIVMSANEAMPRMANLLKAQTDSLGENLDELNDILERAIDRLRAQ